MGTKKKPEKGSKLSKRPTRKVSAKSAKARPSSHQRKWLIWLGLIIPLWSIILLGVTVLWHLRDLPDLNRLQTSFRAPTIELRDRYGRYLMRWGVLHKTVPLEALPPHVPQALLAIEDRRFFDHHGVDGLGLIRALYNNLRGGQKRAQGASTLTQQLAKNLFLSPERSIKRKIQEFWIARWLESHLSKNQILTLYLNRAYFGGGAYGIEAAARTFFAKSAPELTLYESALLMGLLKAPSHYAPLTAGEKARQRAQTVLYAMREAGFLSEEVDLHMPAIETLVSQKPTLLQGTRYFMDWVVSELHQHFGHVRDDLVVITTLDPLTQTQAEEAVQKVLETHQAPKNLQGSCLCLDRDGAVRAMVGGRGYWDSPLNRVTQTQRPAGSAFKFFVFAAALEKGWTPYSTISDLPLRLGRWNPHNYKWSPQGQITLNQAFAHSVNTATVRLAQTVGTPSIQEIAQRLGVKTPQPKDMTLALGSGSVSVLELGGAYHSVLNQGRLTKPYGIIRVLSKNADALKAYTRSSSPPVLKASVIQGMKSLLQGTVSHGTAKRAKIPALSWMGAKTGTSQKHRDAWLVGLSHHQGQGMTTTFWVGYDDGRPMDKVTGGQWPAEMWYHFLMKVYALAPSAASSKP